MRRLLVSVALAGCMSSAPYKPKTVKAESGVTDADLYASTIRIFDDMGLDTREKDKDAGIVASKYTQAGTIMTQRILHAWRVRIEEGTVRISIDCTMTENGVSFYDCTSEGREEKWVAAQPELSRKILQDATERSKKRRAKEAADAEAAAKDRPPAPAAPPTP